MQTKTISRRLARVASFVPQGAKILDIGSDHAYLPIYLLQSGVIEAAVAGEVTQGPFQSAQKNIKEQGFSDCIELRLADGLAAFEAADKIDVIVIAGMGGRLIADILEKGKEKLPLVSRLILQPNNREAELRNWLSEKGFTLVAEEILEESGKIYEILVAEAGQKKLTKEEITFGPFLLAEQSPVFLKKWTGEWEKLEKTFAKIPPKNEQERSAIAQKMQEIKEVVHVSE